MQAKLFNSVLKEPKVDDNKLNSLYKKLNTKKSLKGKNNKEYLFKPSHNNYIFGNRIEQDGDNYDLNDNDQSKENAFKINNQNIQSLQEKNDLVMSDPDLQHNINNTGIIKNNKVSEKDQMLGYLNNELINQSNRKIVTSHSPILYKSSLSRNNERYNSNINNNDIMYNVSQEIFNKLKSPNTRNFQKSLNSNHSKITNDLTVKSRTIDRNKQDEFSKKTNPSFSQNNSIEVTTKKMNNGENPENLSTLQRLNEKLNPEIINSEIRSSEDIQTIKHLSATTNFIVGNTSFNRDKDNIFEFTNKMKFLPSESKETDIFNKLTERPDQEWDFNSNLYSEHNKDEVGLDLLRRIEEQDGNFVLKSNKALISFNNRDHNNHALNNQSDINTDLLKSVDNLSNHQKFQRSSSINVNNSKINAKDKMQMCYKKISPIPFQKEGERFLSSSPSILNSNNQKNSPKMTKRMNYQVEEKDYQKYDIQKLSYNISKGYAHIKIPHNKFFLDRMELYSIKKQIREDKLNELIEVNTVRISEKEKQLTFNHLIEDANRRNKAKQQLDLLQKGDKEADNLQILLSDNELNFCPIRQKKVSSEEFEQIYRERFEEKLKLKNIKIEKEKAEKEILAQQEEEKLVKQIQNTTKKAPFSVIEASGKRMYEQKDKKQFLLDNMKFKNSKRNNASLPTCDRVRSSQKDDMNNYKSQSSSKTYINYDFDSNNQEVKYNSELINSPKIRDGFNSKNKKKKYSHVESKYHNKKNYTKQKRYSKNDYNLILTSQKNTKDNKVALNKNNSMKSIISKKLPYENNENEIVEVDVSTSNLLSQRINLQNEKITNGSNTINNSNGNLNKNNSKSNSVMNNCIKADIIRQDLLINNNEILQNKNIVLTRINDLKPNKDKFQVNNDKKKKYVPDYMVNKLVGNILGKKNII